MNKCDPKDGLIRSIYLASTIRKQHQRAVSQKKKAQLHCVDKSEASSDNKLDINSLQSEEVSVDAYITSDTTRYTTCEYSPDM